MVESIGTQNVNKFAEIKEWSMVWKGKIINHKPAKKVQFWYLHKEFYMLAKMVLVFTFVQVF